MAAWTGSVTSITTFTPWTIGCATGWVRVVMARSQGVPLPPVSLVQVGACYFVEDGHHRISVAHALGQVMIEAEITVWDVRGPLPWEQPAAAALPPRRLHKITASFTHWYIKQREANNESGPHSRWHHRRPAPGRYRRLAPLRLVAAGYYGGAGHRHRRGPRVSGPLPGRVGDGRHLFCHSLPDPRSSPRPLSRGTSSAP